jgi:hypothetical protein
VTKSYSPPEFPRQFNGRHLVESGEARISGAVGSQEGVPRKIANSIVQLATRDEVPLRLISVRFQTAYAKTDKQADGTLTTHMILVIGAPSSGNGK